MYPQVFSGSPRCCVVKVRKRQMASEDFAPYGDTATLPASEDAWAAVPTAIDSLIALAPVDEDEAAFSQPYGDEPNDGSAASAINWVDKSDELGERQTAEGGRLNVLHRHEALVRACCQQDAAASSSA